MELSASTVTGLQLAGSSSVDDKSFSRLVQLSVQAILEDIEPSKIQGNPSCLLWKKGRTCLIVNEWCCVCVCYNDVYYNDGL